MATLSKKVYIAPSAFLAFVDRANQKHEQAVAFFRYFAQEQYQIFTDTLALYDAYKKIYADISPSLSKDFIRGLFLSNINIIHPTESDTKAVLKTLTNYRSSELTFQEALMAVLASRRNILYICTFDYLHPLFGLGTFFLPI